MVVGQHRARVVKAAAMTPLARCGVMLLEVDETRARSVRWLLAEHGWRRSDPWMTSFVDSDPAHPGGILGLAPGRSGGRHLHRLANLMVTQTRQRVTQQVHGHRGRTTNDSWAYRRLLLRGARHLSDKQWARLKVLFVADDPTGEIQAAWAGKELLRQLLDALPATGGPLVTDSRRDGQAASRAQGPGLRPYEIRARLHRFYALAAQADVPELTRLAGTVETWRPAIEAYLRLRVTNARTEGYNRKIKQIKRVACGFRNQDSHERRIMLNNTATATAA